MKLAYFALTEEGKATARCVQEQLGGTLEFAAPFSETVAADFCRYDGLVFVMATGIVVRTIAPLLQTKAHDPAVVVLDQRGEFVISLLSGHLGGANGLARQIAAAIHSVPVITTATDIQGVPAFDLFAKQNHLTIENLSELKYISSALLRGETVELITDCPICPETIPAQIVRTQTPRGKNRVVISDACGTAWTEDGAHTLILRPRSLVVGIGCKKGISAAHLEHCLTAFLEEYHLSRHGIGCFATISLKAQEPAILALCEKYHCPLKIVDDAEIRKCSHAFEASPFVQEVTGLPSVAQACSYLASDCGTELSGKVKFSGVTLAVCRKKREALKFDRR